MNYRKLQYPLRENYTEKVKYVRRVIWALLGIAALMWLTDFAALLLPLPPGKKQWDVVKVDQMYATRNRFNQVEWSHGPAIMETCAYSLFPQTGKRPCWYVKTHTLHTNHLED